MSPHDSDELADPDDPGIAFQAGFGFYFGLVVTGTLAIGGVLADATTATLLGLLPSTLTFVTVAGHIAAKRARGLPERIGGSRLRRLASYVPSGLFAAVPIGAGLVPGGQGGARLVATSLFLAMLTAVSAYGVNRICRKRYTEAMTDDEPETTWTWHRSTGAFGYRSRLTLAVLLIVSGLVSVSFWSWYSINGLFMILWGVATLAELWIDRNDEGTDAGGNTRWNPPEIRAHDAGLVVDGRKLVPWDDIADVRLTDDELVLEREGWRPDIRCDRSAMDDPEAVFEGIERARAGVDAPDRDRPETDLRERDAVGESAPRGNEADPEPESEPADLETRTESERSDLETDTETA